ncbi:transglycosylase domain-containing protein [Ruania halotolerans]|uniref:transglycosylase domain-containing protein n=1 Tax=Ruania halotolerans TaxID=2897773 RepID=UPI001E622438|nr:transglycosylase domain-containing protein [Ruania halotolerans]UFU06505.1 penicillin-binding protein [Ruania halotolerans]
MAQGRGSGRDTPGQGAGRPERRSVRESGVNTAAAGSPSWKRTAGASEGAKRSGSARAGATGNRTRKRKGFWNYPRRGKGPVRRWLPGWRFTLGAAGAVLVLGAALFTAAYLLIDVPEPDDIALQEGSTVTFVDGETPMGTFADVDRDLIDTTQVPDHVGAAIVASEDRRFYSNVGVDPIGIARALWNNLRGNDTQGGSTLTMQYVERYYTGQTSGYVDKFREAVLALKIDQQQSKDEILGAYMNTIYFGRGAYGIERAAQEYFGHPATELTVSEAALLAGIIPSPGNWDPAVAPDQAQVRWERTLEFMVENGNITQAEADEQEFPEVAEPDRTDTYGGPNGYLLTMVRDELIEAGFTEDEIDGGGLQITSTIDPDMQAEAVAASENLPEDTPESVRVALTSIDNETGGILALYGGPDYIERQRNAATQDNAQGGSTFKAFALIAALEGDATLETRYPSYAPMAFDGHEVNNFDTINRGYIDLATATQHSVNTYYMQLNTETGPEALVDVAHRMGLPEDTPGLEPFPSNVLGPASPHPADMAEAYSTIATGGVHRDRFIVESAVNADGETVYTGGGEGEQVVDAQVMADATYAMQQVVQGGTGSTASEIGRPAAGKTGSSNDYRSAWFVGFVPQITTSVAMYQIGEDGEEISMVDGWGGVAPISGGSYPTDIWTEYMSAAVADLPVEEFPERSAPDYSNAPPAAPQEEQPAEEPSEEPTEEETTEEPTEEPSEEPTEKPTQEPTPTPTPTPTPSPTPTDDSDGGLVDGVPDGDADSDGGDPDAGSDASADGDAGAD